MLRKIILPGSLLLLACLAGTAAAEFTPVFSPRLDIVPTAAEITLDGVVEPGEWDDAAVADNFAEHRPGDQIRPPVDTRALVTYDAEHLYVAFLCEDDPATVRASFCRRDQIYQDDNVLVLLDTYGDGATAFELAVNPLGIQGDLFYSANVGEDTSYDLVYHSAGRITDTGYVVEMAIPFSSLRFPDQEHQIWKVDFWRNRPREVRYQMSWAALDRDESCWPCQWGTLHGLRDLTPPKGLELLPAVVSHQAAGRDDDGDFHSGKFVTRGSLSAKYGLTSNVILEATVRPDFSQVESDAAQIDVNSKFALFYPEKRPFFMEGGDLFSTFFNAVYTRSINDPTIAGKVTGRTGKTSFAVLSALDRTTAIILPFAEHSRFLQNGESTANIFRLKHEFGDQTYLGVVGTDRRYTGGGAGSLAGVDGRMRLDAIHSLEMQYLTSFTDEPDDPALTAGFHEETFAGGDHTEGFDGESFTGHGLYAGFERDGRNWFYGFDYWDRSPTFRAENGFETHNDSRYGQFSTSYLLRGGDDSFLEYLQASLYLGRTWNYDGQKKDDSVQLNLSSRFRWAQAANHLQYMAGSEIYHGVEFADVWGVHACGQIVPSDRLSLGGNISYGHRIVYQELVLGRQTDYGLWLDLKPWNGLLIETSYGHSDSREMDGDRRYFDGFVTRTRISLQLTRELSARLILQYNDFAEVWEADPLLSYQLDPFSIFYVGSTRDYRRFSPNSTDTASWQLAQRQYFVKFQYLFRI